MANKVDRVPNFPHERFLKYAKEQPDALAIVSEHAQLTYRELDLSADRLANYLATRGVTANKIVAIQLERSPEMIASVLAVHKAGGGCVFIEPTVPLVRLQKMMGLLQPLFVITSKKYVENYSENEVPVILVDDPDPLLSESPGIQNEVNASSEDIAHIYFTSGSEGEPKAVVFPYGWHVQGDLPEPMSERHLLKTDSGTTFTRAEIMRPLTRGQTLYIAPPGLEKNFRKLAEYIANNALTHLICTPTALRELLAVEEVKACISLRSVTCSGEKITVQVKREFFSRLNAELFVSYGCTEVPGAVSYAMTGDSDPDFDVVGKVSPFMEAYVLNDSMHQLPVGEEGEIYLGGLMAKEYLNDPILTRNKFIPNPFSVEDSARLFKTGDRGRWMRGGYLQVLGRSDGQVKINGFRIEISEVEAIILSLPFVRQAVVVTAKSSAGGANLIAYVVVNSGTISVGDIRAALDNMLPDYMMPAKVLLCQSLPVTSSGKVDRKALTSRTFDDSTPKARLRKPDDCEKQLISIWRSLLDIPKIDVQDNFFDLGGNSLLAAQMIDQIERFFGVKLPLDTVWFRGGAIESLALLLRDHARANEDSPLVKIKDGEGPPLFFVHVRGGHLSDYYHLARCLSPDQTVFGLQARGIFKEEYPDCNVSSMAGHCIQSMRKVQKTGPYLIAGYSSGGIVAYEMAQQLHGMGERVSLLVLLDTFCPSIGRSNRWKKAFRRLAKGKTHNLRDALYSAVVRGLKLDGVLRFRDMHAAHRWAYRHYLPSAYGHDVEFIVATHSINRVNDPLLGWGDYFIKGCHAHQFTANHVNIIKYPRVVDVARLLQNRIDAVVK